LDQKPAVFSLSIRIVFQKLFQLKSFFNKKKNSLNLKLLTIYVKTSNMYFSALFSMCSTNKTQKKDVKYFH